MKTFSDLLDTELWLEVVCNGNLVRLPLHDALEFSADSTVTIDGIEVLPKYRHLANDRVLAINEPFYQWLHRITGQGWLLKPYLKNS